jgi:hypothetical protein
MQLLAWEAAAARLYGLMVIVTVPLTVSSFESRHVQGKLKVPGAAAASPAR